VKKNSGGVAAKRPHGIPVGKPFPKGKLGNKAGRPPGIPNLEARVRALLDGETKLPQPIGDAIRAQKLSQSMSGLQAADTGKFLRLGNKSDDPAITAANNVSFWVYPIRTVFR
jgi:hypothetical protein